MVKFDAAVSNQKVNFETIAQKTREFYLIFLADENNKLVLGTESFNERLRNKVMHFPSCMSGLSK